MKMKTVKSLALSASVAIAICTFLSVLNNIFFGGILYGSESEFYLVGPTGDYNSGPFYSLFTVLNYALIGMVIWTCAELVKRNLFGFTKINLIHFLISVIGSSILTILAQVPIAVPGMVIPFHEWYTESGGTHQLIVIPIVTTLFYYFIVWIIFWFYYRHQIKKLNQKISVSADKTFLSQEIKWSGEI